MRIFLAGATGVIGRRLVPLLLAAGHEVVALTRDPARADDLVAAGATVAVADVYDAAALREVVVAARPELVMHQLTDLPDDAADLAEHRDRNARIRVEGTDNLLAAARAAGATPVRRPEHRLDPAGRGTVGRAPRAGRARVRWCGRPVRPVLRAGHVPPRRAAAARPASPSTRPPAARSTCSAWTPASSPYRRA